MIILLLPSFAPFYNITAAPYSGSKSATEILVAGHGLIYAVAPDGSDSAPGTVNQPWATVNHAAEQAEAGDTIVVRGGHYDLTSQVRPRNSGRPGAWITFIGYPGETPVLDAKRARASSPLPGEYVNGAFQIEDVAYVRVAHLTVVNSHDAGFTIRDSSHIDLVNNTTMGTFGSGIAVWDTNHAGKRTQAIRIIGNTITKATTWDLATPGTPRKGEPPHEALSIGGAVNFEVAYNHVYGNDKEGIDIKETSKHGRVHHNLVHNIGRQGIYVDAWFGVLSDIDIYENVVHDCRLSGLVLSVEGGRLVDNIKIHNNLIFDNEGTGIYFSRWLANGPRRDIHINNNVIYHNGYGQPSSGQTYYWATGGIYLYSTSVSAIKIESNILSDNRGFQIGYSELFTAGGRFWDEARRLHGIEINDNLIYGINNIDTPIESGGYSVDQVKIYAVNGARPILAKPMFQNPANQDFSLQPGSPAATGRRTPGAYAAGAHPLFWWKHDFPPNLIHADLPQVK